MGTYLSSFRKLGTVVDSSPLRMKLRRAVQGCIEGGKEEKKMKSFPVLLYNETFMCSTLEEAERNK